MVDFFREKLKKCKIPMLYLVEITRWIAGKMLPGIKIWLVKRLKRKN